jgi:trimethylamine--corrinoid protein Co-methyltransferase
VVLLRSNKPIVTGALSPHGAPVMIEMLAADSGGHAALRAKPRALFDVCPSPPLHWTEFAAQNLVDLARAWVPAEIISMPLAGAASPVTLAGSVV